MVKQTITVPVKNQTVVVKQTKLISANIVINVSIVANVFTVDPAIMQLDIKMNGVKTADVSRNVAVNAELVKNAVRQYGQMYTPKTGAQIVINAAIVANVFIVIAVEKV